MELSHDVAELRHHSQQLVREYGFLDDGEAIWGLSYAQLHILLELDRCSSMHPSELSEVLNLDRVKISRALSSLDERKLIRTKPDPTDGRKKIIRLSAAGQRRLKAIHARASKRVENALLPLSEHQRTLVVRGTGVHARALKQARLRQNIEIRTIQSRDNAQMAKIIRTVLESFGAIGPGYAGEDPEVDALFEFYNHDDRIYFVLSRKNKILGGGGIAPLQSEPDICELQKMYFLPEVRGLGLGRQLLQRLIHEAKNRGYRRCYLETLSHMNAARHMYTNFGFKPCERLGKTGHFACDRTYIKDLYSDSKIDLVSLSKTERAPLFDIFAQVLKEGGAFPHKAPLTQPVFEKVWLDCPTEVIGVRNANGRWLGAYYLKPNQPDYGAHIANAGYIVATSERGQGIGRRMLEDSIERAPGLGFSGIQFNLVHHANPARRLYESLGWTPIGRVPGGFDDADAIIYHRSVS